MRIHSLVRSRFPTVDAYAPVAAAEAALLREGFAVVLHDGEFVGLLAAEDVVRSPRAIVADCLHDRATIDANASVEAALELMLTEATLVLPVFAGSLFVGVCVRADIAGHLADRSATLENTVSRYAEELDSAQRTLANEAESRARLEDEQLQLLAALEQVAEAIALADGQGRIGYVNRAFERVTGYGIADLGGHEGKLWEMVGLGGPEYQDVRAQVLGGESWTGRVSCVTRTGARYQAETLLSPVLGPGGGIANLLALHRDITQKLRVEMELRRAQRLQALGNLVGGIAHDFNNLLAAIAGYAELTHAGAAEPEKVRSFTAQVLHAADRARALVLQVLRFSRPAVPGTEAVDLEHSLEASALLLRGALPASVRVRTSCRATPRVMANAAEIEQVLVNLGTNAAQAMEERGGTIDFELSELSLSGRGADAEPALPKGRYARIRVRDEGAGIPAEHLDRLFDPFFTTRKLRGGTGLGLSVVHGIVRSWGGAVSVDTIEGKGTTFDVYLPASNDSTVPSPDEAGGVPRGSERVLVVDDFRPLAESTAELLRALGYDATATHSTSAALEMFRAASPPFDVVVADYSMPGLTGVELADALRKDAPDLPVLLVTGYLEGVPRVPSGPTDVLVKPFDSGSLGRALRRLIDARRASHGRQPGAGR